MADKKISELTALASGDVVDTDLVPIVDTSGTETKSFTWANLKAALKTYLDTLYVRFTGTPSNNQLGVWTSADTLEGDAGLTWTGSILELSHTNPVIKLNETDATTDNKIWSMKAEGEEFIFQAIADAGGGGGSLWAVGRTGTEITDMTGRRGGTDRIKLDNWNNHIAMSNAAAKIRTTSAHTLTLGANSTDILTLNTDGSADFSGNVSLGDNDHAYFGTGNDLQIYHSGAHSLIKHSGTGSLYVDSANYLALRVNTNENAIVAVANGAVTLYHNAVAKLATTNTGVTVTGTLTTDGISVGDNEYAYFGTGNDLQIVHDGVNSYVRGLNGTGVMYVDSIGNTILRVNNTENAVRCVANGSVTLYHDNVVKLATRNDGIKVTGGLMETVYSLTGTAIDPGNGSIQYKTLAANTTFTENIDNGQSVLLMIDDGTAYTITWPTTTWLTDSGSAPTLETTGYTAISLWQMNGTLYGAKVNS